MAMRSVGKMLVVLFVCAGVSQAAWTWDESGAMVYDGAGADSGIDPYTLGSSDGDVNIANSSGGVATLTVLSGTLTIKPQTNWADKVGHMPGSGTPAYDYAGAVTVENGATLNMYVNNDNEDRLVFGNNIRNGHFGRATVTLNGGDLNIIGDATFDDAERQVRFGSDGGIADLVLNAGTMTIHVNLPVAFGDKWLNGGTAWTTAASPSVSTLTIVDGSLVCTGSNIFGVGSNDKINFVTGGTGMLSILNWTTAEFQALVTAGNLQIDGADVLDLSQFVVIEGGAGSQGTLSLANKIKADAPSNLAVNVPINQDLLWTVLDPAVEYIDLYFGTENDPNLSAKPANKQLSMVPAAVTTWDTGVLAYSTTYYWKIDTYEPNTAPGATDYIVTPGGVWRFTSIGQAPTVTAVSPAKTIVDTGAPSAVLSVTGTNAETYQWYKVGTPDTALSDGANYTGTATNTLTINDVQLADEGYYYCQVANSVYPDPVASAAGLVMTKRLVIHYPLDSVVSGVTPDVVGGFNMTLAKNTATLGYPTLETADMKIGSGALLFNNLTTADPNHYGQYATAGDVDIEAMGSGFTVELWMNFAGTNGAGAMGLVARRNAWASGQMMWGVEARPAGDVYFATGGNATALAPTVQGEWNHVAITHDGSSTARVYVNGEFRAQHTNVPYWGGSDSPLMLAASDYSATTGAAANFFNGMLDDIKFYNYVKTSAEIAQDYLAVEGGWVCNREAPALAYDFNGNCMVDIEDFSIFAASWLESNRVYPE